VLVTEHESGHGKLVLLVVSEPQYYEFSYFIQCLIRKRQQSLACKGFVSNPIMMDLMPHKSVVIRRENTAHQNAA